MIQANTHTQREKKLKQNKTGYGRSFIYYIIGSLFFVVAVVFDGVIETRKNYNWINKLEYLFPHEWNENAVSLHSYSVCSMYVCVCARFLLSIQNIKWNESIYWCDSQACFLFNIHSWISEMIFFLPCRVRYLSLSLFFVSKNAFICWYAHTRAELHVVLFANYLFVSSWIFFSCFEHHKPIWIADTSSFFLYQKKLNSLTIAH